LEQEICDGNGVGGLVKGVNEIYPHFSAEYIINNALLNGSSDKG
jgi:hypothetical protein